MTSEPLMPADPRPQRRERLADQIYGHLLESIVGGRYEAADRLPTEKQLAASYDVSRPVVREALMRLQADGLIISRQGAGTFIAKRPPRRMIELAKAQDIADYLRAMEVRDALEGQSARLAAERHNAEQMSEITRALDAMRRALDEGTATAEVDYAFHRAVALASGNIVIVEILEALNETITGGMQVALGLTREGSRERSQRVVDEHVRVHEAILAREAASAEIAMRYHIDQARRRLTDRRRDT